MEVVDVSINICTYNRCESLRKTLEAFHTLVIPPGTQCELLVVDNNSKDATRSVCEQYRGSIPLRYMFEARQGKSCALNRAIQETAAPLLALTDDDVTMDANWLVALLDSVKRHPEAEFFGGQIEPRWEMPPPRWLEEHARELLKYVMVYYTAGDVERLYTREEVRPFGANLLFRRRIFDQGFAFNESIGLKGSDPTRGEETELIDRLYAKGHKGVYVPKALVFHRNFRQRMTERYIREWYKGQGMIQVRLNEVPTDKLVFGAPRWAVRDWIEQAIVYSLSRWTRPSKVWLNAEIKMASAWGMICESRRRTRGDK